MNPDTCLSSMAGGTDLLACFALGCPILPVYRGELKCQVDQVDEVLEALALFRDLPELPA